MQGTDTGAGRCGRVLPYWFYWTAVSFGQSGNLGDLYAALLSIFLPSFRTLYRRRAACSRPMSHGSGRARSALEEFRWALAKHGRWHSASGKPTAVRSSQGCVPASAVAVPRPPPPLLLSELWPWMPVQRGVPAQPLRRDRPLLLDLRTTLYSPEPCTAKRLRAFVVDRANQPLAQGERTMWSRPHACACAF